MKASVVLFSLFSTLAAASPINIASRDVFVPPILYPHAGTVWKVGQHHNVTWDVSDAPAQITNPVGQVFLRQNGLTQLSNPLAQGFNILDGRVVIQVPNVAPAKDYQLVLFGDSGNFSPLFTITK
ncbi:hypothetical protein BDQ17DRAFT_1362831 [Cyathus striatus]|nr:hypothetical protein BDQ17DRAFT_1362831 [Cyathus striatus]